MKKFLTQQINFSYAIIVMLALTVGVSMASGYASPGQSGDLNPVIHRGGGEQVIDTLRLGTCSSLLDPACNPIGEFDARGPNGSVSTFDEISGAKFYVLFLTNVLGQTFITDDQVTGENYWSAVYNGFSMSDQLQSVNVRGDVSATNLASPAAKGNEPVCFTPSGNLVKCVTTTDPIVGSCGPADSTPIGSAPSSGLCDSGTPSNVSGGSGSGLDYSWTCYGENGGADDSCSAPYQIAGSCGLADGQAYNTTPDSGLCESGTASSVTDNSPLGSPAFSWTCTGTNGGATDSCSANYQSLEVNGQCIVYDEGPYLAQPATNTAEACQSGTYSNTPSDTTDQWQWSCNGSGGGTNDLCQANRVIQGATCTAYSGTHSSQPANNTSNGCDSGSYSDLADNINSWRWQCALNGQTSTCSAQKEITYVACDQACNPSNNIQCQDINGPSGHPLECQGSSQEPPTTGPGVCAYYSGATPLWENC